MTTRTPKNPAAAEATGSSISVDFRGQAYEVPPSTDWPFDALEALEQNRVATFLLGVLGDEGYATFKATKPKVSDASEFFRAVLEAVGIRGN